MKVALVCCTALSLGLIGCGGASGTTTVSGTSPAAIRSAPAGVATLAFTDIEQLSPAMVSGGASLPTGITASTPTAGTTTYTYANVPAANTGAMSGTVSVVQSGSTYTLTYNLAVPSSTIAGSSEAPVHPETGAAVTGWTYTGSATLTIVPGNTNAATLSVPGIVAAYTDVTTPANNRTYTFTGNLSATWVNNVSATLSGGYAFAQTLPANGVSISVAINQPLNWGPFTTCDFPLAGTLTLTLASGSTTTETATAIFTSTCGQLTLNGATLKLGHH